MKVLSHMFSHFIRIGTLRVIGPDGRIVEFGNHTEPSATIHIHDQSLPIKLFRNPELHAGEAYMDGTLTFEDCTVADFLNVFSVNRSGMASYPLQNVLRRISRMVRAFQQYNPIGKAQEKGAQQEERARKGDEIASGKKSLFGKIIRTLPGG